MNVNQIFQGIARGESFPLLLNRSENYFLCSFMGAKKTSFATNLERIILVCISFAPILERISSYAIRWSWLHLIKRRVAWRKARLCDEELPLLPVGANFLKCIIWAIPSWGTSFAFKSERCLWESISIAHVFERCFLDQFYCLPIWAIFAGWYFHCSKIWAILLNYISIALKLERGHFQRHSLKVSW